MCAEYCHTGHTWSVCTPSCPFDTKSTALVASHLLNPVQNGVVNVHSPRQLMPSVPQRPVVSVSSEPGRHHLCSATNLNYILPRTRTKVVERAFYVSGSIVWNSLPSSVRSSPTVTGFKRSLKSHF